MDSLETQKLTLAYGEALVITDLDLAVPTHRIAVLVGPNGCGKSTLLRGLARLLKPRGGAVLLEGSAIAKLPTKEVAKRLGILPQGPVAPEGLTVRELVAQGRYPHQGWLQQWSPEDERMVQRALDMTGMVPLAERPLDSLSGGQRQKAWIAMALAQDTPILLLDEPTTFLDPAHQLEVLDLVQALNTDLGRTVVMVLHDLNHAARYGDHVVAMSEGRIAAAGHPKEVLTPDLLRQVFGLDWTILSDPVTGTPLCIPHRAQLHDASHIGNLPLSRRRMELPTGPGEDGRTQGVGQ